MPHRSVGIFWYLIIKGKIVILQHDTALKNCLSTVFITFAGLVYHYRPEHPLFCRRK